MNIRKMYELNVYLLLYVSIVNTNTHTYIDTGTDT